MRNSKDLKEEIINKLFEEADPKEAEHMINGKWMIGKFGCDTVGMLIDELVECAEASLNQEWRERIEKVTERKLREPILKEEDLVRRARIRLKSWNKAMAHVRKSLLNPEA